MRRLSMLCLPIVCLLLVCGVACADPKAEAQQLKDEAVKILQAGSAAQADPKTYAQCVIKLERALDLLEANGGSESALAQEVTAALFWARRFSNFQIIDEIKRQQGQPVSPPIKKPDPPAVKPPPAGEPAEAPSPIAEAKKIFGEGERYASSHSGDDYQVALKWFQIADQTTGTDFSLKALAMAREAQQRYSSKQAPKVETLPDTPAMKLVKEADALAKAGKLEESIAIFRSSIKTEDTIVAHRKLGHAFFDRAQQIKDELLPLYEANEARIKQAWKESIRTVRMTGGQTYKRQDKNYPPLLDAYREQAALFERAKVALKNYDDASSEFKSVLRLAPKGKDLDAAAHVAMCVSVRGDALMRVTARSLLLQFLDDYQPANDLERTLYGFCKSELDRISKR